jgi:cell division septation protein DedD
MQWAAFARPKSAYDQVATLLGVTPVQDSGQPLELALNGSGPAMAQVVQPLETPVQPASENATAVAQDAATPVPAAEANVAVAAVAVAPAAVASAPAPAPAFSGVVFGPRQEVVQRLPAVAIVAAPVRMGSQTMPARAVVKTTRTSFAKGSFFVQLGAFQNAGVAKDAWGRATRRDVSFAAHSPSGMNISTSAGSFYRLSVGGFARTDAVALCESYRAKGGTCFVRAAAGDQAASWARPAGQIASR